MFVCLTSDYPHVFYNLTGGLEVNTEAQLGLFYKFFLNSVPKKQTLSPLTFITFCTFCMVLTALCFTSQLLV